MKLFKSIIKILIGAGIIYVLAVTFFVLKPDINDYLNRTKFESTEWIKWEETESSFGIRWNMTNDLTKDYNLEGKTKEEIKKILGIPSNESKNEISYYLGLTGHGINTAFLSIKFEKERVIKFIIGQG
jgi:hypothetical protein